MKQIARSLRLAQAGLMVWVVAGCGGDLTLPDNSGAGFDLTVVAGNGQTGTVGEPLPTPLVVQVSVTGGVPASGRRVAFLRDGGAGGFAPDTAVTDAEGKATTSWVMGTAPGAYTGVARLVTNSDSAPPTVPIQAAAVPGEPDSLRAVGPTVQAGRRNEQLSQPLVVATLDRFGNPVSGVDVSWEVTVGDGSLSQTTTRTGPDGQTSVRWTLGNKSGVQRVAATVGGLAGSPVTFIATVLF